MTENYKEILKSKIRPVTDEDRGKLLTASYSKLDIKKQCSFKYDLRYNKKNFSHKGSIATDIGSLVHWCLEQKAINKLSNIPVSYKDLLQCAIRGVDTAEDGRNKHIYGIDELKRLYPEEFYSLDSYGRNYSQKLEFFFNQVLPNRMEEVNGWTVWGAEVPFEFVYDNKCIFHGYIDRIDVSMDNGNPIIRVVDYKTSKKTYMAEKIKTPMQFFIYDLACLSMFNIIPSEHMYDFVLIDEQQTEKDGLCTFGYLRRGKAALDKILTSIDEDLEHNLFAPKPSPLCYFCEFCKNNPNAEANTKELCPYYSLWTPENRVYDVNLKYDPGSTPRTLQFDF